MNRLRWARSGALAIGCSAIVALSAHAQDTTSSWQWNDRAELTFVFTGGNASSSTFGAKNTLVGEGPNSKFQLVAGGIRTESEMKTRVATGTPSDFDISETSQSEVTAENYFARARYTRSVAAQAFVFGGAGWSRNTFSGIQNRLAFVTGFGSQWVDRDDLKFGTDVGITYTIQENVVSTNGSETFAGLQASVELFRRLTETATYELSATADENLRTTEDFRADVTNSLSVSISSKLALKTSLQLLFDNDPSLVSVPLQDPTGTPTGDTVLAELDKLDTVFTLALVINI